MCCMLKQQQHHRPRVNLDVGMWWFVHGSSVLLAVAAAEGEVVDAVMAGLNVVAEHNDKQQFNAMQNWGLISMPVCLNSN